MRKGEVHALAGRRFAVILQGSWIGATSTIVFAPTSMSARPAEYRPEIHLRGRQTRVMADQITTVDRSRIGRRVGELDAQELAALDHALKLVLGLL